MKKLLIIEDDEIFAERLKKNLEIDGYETVISNGGKDALSKLKDVYFDLVITDIKMPEMTGLDVIKKIRSGSDAGIDADIPIVVLTSVNSVETAVEAMKGGAADYITKESERKEILLRVKKVLDQSKILNENRLLKDRIERESEFGDLIGESESIKKIKSEIKEISKSNVSILIEGETGVGKELVARAIHKLSEKYQGPFIDVNCAALPDENLFQSELFGHEKGAFTDAKELKKGKFELANGGILFLDEIAEMSKDSQGKILKVIENHTITRLGGSKSIDIDCRFIFATNKNLFKEMKAGKFREDLYYRVNVFPIYIEPLRQRKEDIPLLSNFFLNQFCKKYQKPHKLINSETMKILFNYPWYGNVRELRNVLERIVIRSKSDEITYEDIKNCGLLTENSFENLEINISDDGINLDEIEKKLVFKALEKADWNQTKAASLLGITVDRMNNRVKKFDLRNPLKNLNKTE